MKLNVFPIFLSCADASRSNKRNFPCQISLFFIQRCSDVQSLLKQKFDFWLQIPCHVMTHPKRKTSKVSDFLAPYLAYLVQWMLKVCQIDKFFIFTQGFPTIKSCFQYHQFLIPSQIRQVVSISFWSFHSALFYYSVHFNDFLGVG